jgi:predicted Fe-Mo cluster-binding NifX family protein
MAPVKIVVSAEGPDLEDQLGINFARSRYYLLVDVETSAHTALANPWSMARGGAGPQAAAMVAGQQPVAVVTGLIGPNAFATLDGAGIPVFAAPRGTAREAVQAYRTAHLVPLLGPNAEPHAPFHSLETAHANLLPRSGGPRRGPRASRRPSRDVDASRARLHERARELEEELAATRARLADLAKSDGRS